MQELSFHGAEMFDYFSREGIGEFMPKLEESKRVFKLATAHV
jgi:hypothetical protein